MKTALIRLLTLVSLATSLSTFATADESKRHDSANTSSSQQSGCVAGEEKKQDQQKKPQTDDSQEREFDRVLMGIYG
jgi:hypothetical protein